MGDGDKRPSEERQTPGSSKKARMTTTAKTKRINQLIEGDEEEIIFLTKECFASNDEGKIFGKDFKTTYDYEEIKKHPSKGILKTPDGVEVQEKDKEKDGVLIPLPTTTKGDKEVLINSILSSNTNQETYRRRKKYQELQSTLALKVFLKNIKTYITETHRKKIDENDEKAKKQLVKEAFEKDLQSGWLEAPDFQEQFKPREHMRQEERFIDKTMGKPETHQEWKTNLGKTKTLISKLIAECIARHPETKGNNLTRGTFIEWYEEMTKFQDFSEQSWKYYEYYYPYTASEIQQEELDDSVFDLKNNTPFTSPSKKQRQ